jgi:predicted phage baseplate assembly protein
LSAATKAALNQWNGANPPPAPLLAALAADLNELLETWLPQRDLLESGTDDSQFVVEMDDNGLAHLRFGDGVCGRQPEAGMEFLACYRIGNGTAGNVGAERISKIALRTSTVEGVSISARNPLPAQGGTDPEPVAEVKLFAPGAFKKVIKRAITAADYATIAERNPKLQQANADLRWTGSWFEAQVAVDPLGTESPDESMLRNVRAHLNHFRRLGHDLAVNAAEYVRLQLAMDICVLPTYQRGHVEAELLDVFSNGVLASGQLGFFNPDNLTFGEGIYLSQIVAAAQAVTGVQSVSVTAFQRLFAPADGELTSGVLKLAPNEIAQLDNDPNFPEHGTLTLNLRGGR